MFMPKSNFGGVVIFIELNRFPVELFISDQKKKTFQTIKSAKANEKEAHP